jgi:hypothetical protein
MTEALMSQKNRTAISHILLTIGTQLGLPTLKRENTGHNTGAVDESPPQAKLFFSCTLLFVRFNELK